jgi:hypothetical protein
MPDAVPQWTLVRTTRDAWHSIKPVPVRAPKVSRLVRIVRTLAGAK